MKEVTCYRVGQKIGKNIYAQVGDEPSDEDVDLGRMDTEHAAEAIVKLANIGIEKLKEDHQRVVV